MISTRIVSILTLAFATFSVSWPAVTAPQPPSQLCCVDLWDQDAVNPDVWQPRNMGPGQRQRLMRHRTFMNDGVPTEYQGARSPFDAKPETIADGAGLYAENCATCHGARGFGDGDAGRGLSPSPAMLGHMVQMPLAVSEYLFWTIADGGGAFGTDMPAFKTTLSDEDIWKIIAYMRAGFPPATDQ
ncbi:MAG: cytochrome c [Pseudomonadota bacterium]